MIINKTTSNSVVVKSLVLVDSNQKPIANVTEFNTDTKVATISGGPTTEVVTDLRFVVANQVDMEILLSELPEELHPFMSFRVNYVGKRTLDDVDILPTHHFTIIGAVSPCLVQCSNCATIFLVVFGQGKVWGTSKPNITDKSFTLTELDPEAIVCNNCFEIASIYEP